MIPAGSRSTTRTMPARANATPPRQCGNWRAAGSDRDRLTPVLAEAPGGEPRTMNAPTKALPVPEADDSRLQTLRLLEKKLLWLSAWMIHNANHVRPNRDGLKVGGHQASCASCISILAALYFEIARPQDRIAVKPHAGPVFHAINWLFGRQNQEKMENLRRFGGAQSYPSRVKDGGEVDFSTGSVGLGVAMTSFSALMQDYVH